MEIREVVIKECNELYNYNCINYYHSHNQYRGIIGYNIDYIMDIREIVEFRSDCIWVNDEEISAKKLELDKKFFELKGFCVSDSFDNKFNISVANMLYIDNDTFYFERDYYTKINYNEWLVKKILE